MSALIEQYPRLKFVDQNTVSEQYRHVRSEIEEVWRELEISYPDIDDPERMAMEVYDVILSSVTMLLILAERYGLNLGKIERQVIYKNAERGYEA